LQNYHVEFFETESGEVPAEAFIDSLDMKMSAKVYRLLDMIERNGSELREQAGHCHERICEKNTKDAKI
jgi:hypothetical protein